jgi:hypothetical protein
VGCGLRATPAMASAEPASYMVQSDGGLEEEEEEILAWVRSATRYLSCRVMKQSLLHRGSVFWRCCRRSMFGLLCYYYCLICGCFFRCICRAP